MSSRVPLLPCAYRRFNAGIKNRPSLFNSQTGSLIYMRSGSCLSRAEKQLLGTVRLDRLWKEDGTGLPFLH